MKGVVFTEFLDMVEDKFGLEIADRIIEESSLPSGGAYTAIGTYDHSEMITLVTALSGVTNMAAVDLVKSFGEHLFGRFHAIYPVFFQKPRSAFEFIESIDSVIHVEVRKLYPDAELPHFECRRAGDDILVVTYSSTRPFGDLAEGLIRACGRHYGEALRIDRQPIATPAHLDAATKRIEFTLTRQ